MGVRGLNRFVDNNPGLTKPYELHDTRVVIDGSNLAHNLYSNIPCIYGGEYDRYASEIKNYFSAYEICQIEPIIIFDGGDDKSDKKLQTIFSRREEKFEVVDCIANNEPPSDDVLPVLCIRLFINTLKELNIPHAQCSYEADGALCSIGNYYQCPVISMDSDFYIFDLRFGFIRTDYIDLTVKTGRKENGQKYSFLKCGIYYFNNFSSSFPGIRKNVLPLFSTLLGNDFIDASTFDKFFQSDDFPIVRSKKVKARHMQMIGLLEWLKMYRDVNDAIEDVLSYLPSKKRRKVKALIQQSLKSYIVPRTNVSLRSSNTRSGTALFAISPTETLISFKGVPLPPWFVKSFHNVDIHAEMINIIGLRRLILPVQVQDTALRSLHECSLPIRKVLYGLLVSLDNVTEHSAKQNCIDEYDRLGGAVTLKKEYITPTMRLNGFGLLPKLCNLPHLAVEDAKLLISCTLKERAEYLNDLPENLHLIVICIRYWLKNAFPKPCTHFFDALLLTILYLSVAEPLVPDDSKTADHRLSNYRKLARSAQMASVVDLIKTVNKSNATYFSKNIQRYLQEPILNNNNPFLISMVHRFDQLQSCVLHLLMINDVINKPFPDLQIQRIFSGRLIYNLTRELQLQNSPESYVSELLGCYSALDFLFKKLRSKVLENLPVGCFQVSAGVFRRRRRR